MRMLCVGFMQIETFQCVTVASEILFPFNEEREKSTEKFIKKQLPKYGP
jgi:hypothetical protein